MSFETVSRNTQAIQRRVVLADPQSLRECADRLEHAAKAAVTGESVICELTPSVTVVYKPEVIDRFVSLDKIDSAFGTPYKEPKGEASDQHPI